jgi:hypothetical protein
MASSHGPNPSGLSRCWWSRGITPRCALRLAKFFSMTPDFGMTMQLRWDLCHARQAERVVILLAVLGRGRRFRSFRGPLPNKQLEYGFHG